MHQSDFFVWRINRSSERWSCTRMFSSPRTGHQTARHFTRRRNPTGPSIERVSSRTARIWKASECEISKDYRQVNAIELGWIIMLVSILLLSLHLTISRKWSIDSDCAARLSPAETSCPKICQCFSASEGKTLSCVASTIAELSHSTRLSRALSARCSCSDSIWPPQPSAKHCSSADHRGSQLEFSLGLAVWFPSDHEHDQLDSDEQPSGLDSCVFLSIVPSDVCREEQCSALQSDDSSLQSKTPTSRSIGESVALVTVHVSRSSPTTSSPGSHRWSAPVRGHSGPMDSIDPDAKSTHPRSLWWTSSLTSLSAARSLPREETRGHRTPSSDQLWLFARLFTLGEASVPSMLSKTPPVRSVWSTGLSFRTRTVDRSVPEGELSSTVCTRTRTMSAAGLEQTVSYHNDSFPLHRCYSRFQPESSSISFINWKPFSQWITNDHRHLEERKHVRRCHYSIDTSSPARDCGLSVCSSIGTVFQTETSSKIHWLYDQEKKKTTATEWAHAK